MFLSIPAAGKVGVQFYLSAGMMSNDFSTLNSKLNEFGYISIDNTKFNLGLGDGLIIKKKWFVGFDIGFFKGGGLTGEGSCGYSGGYFVLSCGYEVYRNGIWSVYPEFGFGIRSVNLRLSRVVEKIEFSDILSDPGRTSVLRCENGIVRVGFSANRKFSNKPVGTLFFVGISLGYDFADGATSWDTGHFEEKAGPKVDQSGFYLKISVGILLLENKGGESR